MQRLLTKARQVKARLGPLWWHSGLFFVLMRFGDLCNVYIGVFLVPDFVDQEKLGAVLPLTRLATFVGLPLLVVVQTSMKFLNVFFVREERGKIKQLLQDLGVISVILSAVIVAYLVLAAPFIQARLKFDDRTVIWLVGALAVLQCWSPVATAAAQGLRRFYTLTLAGAARPLVRLIVVVLLIERLQLAGYLSASLLSGLFGLSFILFNVRGFTRGAVPRENYRKHWPEMMRYLVPLGLSIAVLALQSTIEPWIVRQRLSKMDSAGFYIAAMFGFIPSFLAGAVQPFLFTLVSEKAERKESTRRYHLQTVAFVSVLGFLASVFLFFTAEWILGLRAVWREYIAYAPHVWRLGLVTTMQAAIACHIAHETACRRFRYLWYLAPIVVLEVGGLYGLMGWAFFRPWLPDGVWRFVAGFDVRNLTFVIHGMMVARLLIVAFILVEVWRLPPARGEEKGLA